MLHLLILLLRCVKKSTKDRAAKGKKRTEKKDRVEGRAAEKSAKKKDRVEGRAAEKSAKKSALKKRRPLKAALLRERTLRRVR